MAKREAEDGLLNPAPEKKSRLEEPEKDAPPADDKPEALPLEKEREEDDDGEEADKCQGLEYQLFEWERWDQGYEPSDMYFTGIKMKVKLADFPSDEQIQGVDWLPSYSKAIFYFKDGTQRDFGLKISLMQL